MVEVGFGYGNDGCSRINNEVSCILKMKRIRNFEIKKEGEDKLKKEKMMFSKILLFISVMSALLAFVGSMGADLWLASTQWMLVGLTTAVWSVYILISLKNGK